MIEFTTIIKKYGAQGEKTGWTFIEVPAALTNKLIPGNKKAFRVKGKLDTTPIEKISLVPIGEGNFIMPLKAALRKQLNKQTGATLSVQLSLDDNRLPLPAAFLECLNDEPDALAFFKTLPMSHQNYFARWLTEPKGENAQATRMATAVTAMAKGQHFGEMIRSLKKNSLKNFRELKN